MRRMLFIILILMIFILPAAAMEKPSLTLGTWSFLLSDDCFESGSYGYAGITEGISDRFELTTFTLFRMTPGFGDELYQGIGINASLLNPRSAEGYAVPSYLSIYADAGVLFGFHDLGDDLSHSFSLYLRVSPLSVGTYHYGSRERLLTIGLLYTPAEHRFGISLSPVLFDRYF